MAETSLLRSLGLLALLLCGLTQGSPSLGDDAVSGNEPIVSGRKHPVYLHGCTQHGVHITHTLKVSEDVQHMSGISSRKHGYSWLRSKRMRRSAMAPPDVAGTTIDGRRQLYNSFLRRVLGKSQDDKRVSRKSTLSHGNDKESDNSHGNNINGQTGHLRLGNRRNGRRNRQSITTTLNPLRPRSSLQLDARKYRQYRIQQQRNREEKLKQMRDAFERQFVSPSPESPRADVSYDASLNINGSPPHLVTNKKLHSKYNQSRSNYEILEQGGVGTITVANPNKVRNDDSRDETTIHSVSSRKRVDKEDQNGGQFTLGKTELFPIGEHSIEMEPTTASPFLKESQAKDYLSRLDRTTGGTKPTHRVMLNNNQVTEITKTGTTSSHRVMLNNNQVTEITTTGTTSSHRVMLNNNQVTEITKTGVTSSLLPTSTKPSSKRVSKKDDTRKKKKRLRKKKKKKGRKKKRSKRGKKRPNRGKRRSKRHKRNKKKKSKSKLAKKKLRRKLRNKRRREKLRLRRKRRKERRRARRRKSSNGTTISPLSNSSHSFYSTPSSLHTDTESSNGSTYSHEIVSDTLSTSSSSSGISSLHTDAESSIGSTYSHEIVSDTLSTSSSSSGISSLHTDAESSIGSTYSHEIVSDTLSTSSTSSGIPSLHTDAESSTESKYFHEIVSDTTSISSPKMSEIQTTKSPNRWIAWANKRRRKDKKKAKRKGRKKGVARGSIAESMKRKGNKQMHRHVLPSKLPKTTTEKSPFIDYKSAFDFLSNQKRVKQRKEEKKKNEEFSQFMGENMCEIFNKHYRPTNIGGVCV